MPVRSDRKRRVIERLEAHGRISGAVALAHRARDLHECPKCRGVVTYKEGRTASNATLRCITCMWQVTCLLTELHQAPRDDHALVQACAATIAATAQAQARVDQLSRSLVVGAHNAAAQGQEPKPQPVRAKGRRPGLAASERARPAPPPVSEAVAEKAKRSDGTAWKSKRSAKADPQEPGEQDRPGV